MKKYNPANYSVCDNCGELMDSDTVAVTVQIHQKPFQFCPKCDTERSANLALMNMTWGNAT